METIKGYVNETPELSYISNGSAILKFKTSKEKEETNYYKQDRIVVWGELAEKANDVLNFGDYIYLKGYWKTREWESADGKNHDVKEFTAKQIWIVEDNKYTDINDIEVTEEQE